MADAPKIDVSNIEASVQAMKDYGEAVAEVKVLTGEVTKGTQQAGVAAAAVAAEYKTALELVADAKIHGEERIKQLDEEASKLQEQLVTKRNLTDAEKKHNVEIQTQIDKLDEEIAAVEEIRDIRDDDLTTLQNITKETEANARALGEVADASASLSEYTQDALTAATGIGPQFKKSAMGAFLVIAKADGIAAALAKVGEGLKEVLTLENLAGSFLAGVAQQTMGMVFAVDNAQNAFSKATGMGDAYNDMIFENYEANAHLGVSIDDSSAAFQGLMNSMAGFGIMAEDTRRKFAGMSSVMNEAGVDIAASGELWVNTTKVMGMSGAESEKMAGNLKGLSKTLGVSFGQITGDFNSVMGDLSVYGKEAPKVFARLAGAAAATGISIDGLVGSMKELDTIEGAARRAGKLNAALQGQYLDTHELLSASYADRILLVKKALVESGKEFDTMSRAERQMVMNASGMSNMADLAKMMNTPLSELTETMNKAGEASGSFTDIEDAAAAAQGVQEKLAMTMQKLAIVVQPLIAALHWLVDVFAAIVSNPIGKWGMILGAVFYFIGSGAAAAAAGIVTGFVSAIWSGIAAVGQFVIGLWAKITGLGASAAAQAADTAATVVGTAATAANTTATQTQAAAQTAATNSGGGFVKFLNELGNISKKALFVILALAVAFVLIGIGIAIAAWGMAQFVKSFAGMSAGQILAISVALLIFALMIVAIVVILALAAPALATAALGLLAFGFAVLMVGVAVLLMALAFGMFVSALMLLVPHASTLLVVGAALTLIAFASMLMLPAGLMAMIGLGMLALGLGALAIALAFISTDDLVALGNMFMGLGAFAAAVAGGGLADAIPMIEELMDALLEAADDIESSVTAFSSLAMSLLMVSLLAALGIMMLVPGLVALNSAAVITMMVLPALGVALMQFAIAANLAATSMTPLAPAAEAVAAGLISLTFAMWFMIPVLPIFFAFLPSWTWMLMVFTLMGPATMGSGAGILFLTAALLALLPVLPLFFMWLPFWWSTLAVFSLLVPVIMMLAAAVLIIAVTGFLAFLGLMWLSFGLDMVAGSLRRMPEDSLMTLASFMVDINSLTDSAVDRMYDLADAIRDVADSLWWMSMWRALQFSMMLHEVGYAGEHIADITPAAVANVEGLTMAAEEYSRIRWGFMGVDMNPFVNMLKATKGVAPRRGGGNTGGAGGAGGRGGDAGEGTTGPTVVVLQLDGKELGRTVEKLLSKRNKLRSITT